MVALSTRPGNGTVLKQLSFSAGNSVRLIERKKRSFSLMVAREDFNGFDIYETSLLC